MIVRVMSYEKTQPAAGRSCSEWHELGFTEITMAQCFDAQGNRLRLFRLTAMADARLWRKWLSAKSKRTKRDNRPREAIRERAK